MAGSPKDFVQNFRVIELGETFDLRKILSEDFGMRFFRDIAVNYIQSD